MNTNEGPGRLEALSDAIFGLALTFLVVRMDVPHSFSEFQAMTAGFAGFFVTFILLFVIWNKQGRFLRAIEYVDNTIKYLTAGFLFLILYFVFPLKYLFTLTLELFIGPGFTSEPLSRNMDSETIAQLLRLFALGIGAIYALLITMYVHALRKRAVLGLLMAPSQAKVEIFHYVILVALAACSYVLSLWLKDTALYWAGLVYLFILPVRLVPVCWKRLAFAD